MKGKDEMDMSTIPCHIEGAYVKKVEPYRDSRGQAWEHPRFPNFQPRYEFESYSLPKTFRGFHFQTRPYEQDKVVHLTYGDASSLIVDLRINSRTFLDIEVVRLDPFKWLYVPVGCAHGLYVHHTAQVLYKMGLADYHSQSYHRLRFDDTQLSIHWERIGDIDHISREDFNGETLAELALKGLLFP